MGALETVLEHVKIPAFAKATQHFDISELTDSDITTTVAESFTETGLLKRILPGQRIGITAGSRGIDRIDQVMLATVNLVKSQGATPFIVPCMGSHGGGNAVGQRAVLAHLGIDETTMGAEVVAQDDVVQIGTTESGSQVFVDAFLAECDGIIALNRVKKHTMFTAPVESGVLKIMAVGMGKQKGAQACHAKGPGGMCQQILDLSGMIMEKLPVIGGLAVVENALGKLCLCQAMLSENIVKEEAKILQYAISRQPEIPFDDLDLLVVCEMGKDVSGSGMDTNVIGRFGSPTIVGKQKSDRLVTLSLTHATDGNALGMGYADFISKRLYNQIDPTKTYLTVLTNHVLKPSYTPPIMQDDDFAIRAGIETCAQTDKEHLRCMVVLNTHTLSTVYVSEAMAPEVEAHPNVSLSGAFAPLPLDETGYLDFASMFPSH